MSFKVEIEIEVELFKDDDCLECPFLRRYDDEEPAECRAFHTQLEFAAEHYGGYWKTETEWYIKRCPECIEAEKQYKEKENEKVSAP